MGLSPVQISSITEQMDAKSAVYARVRLIKDYVNGDTPAQLSDDQKRQIVGSDSAGNPNSDPEVRLNVCEPPIAVEANRLKVQDITVTIADDPERSQQLSELIWKWWKRSRLDEGQQHAHYAACRDGDSFAIPYYDQDAKWPKVAIHPVYDGETSGVDKFYTDGDPLQPEAGYKIWIAKETGDKKIRRKNIYYHDRVEKWISTGDMTGKFTDADWKPLQYGDDDFTEDLVEVESLSQPGKLATVAWWTESGTERSPGMGIPVFHFRHDARGTAYGTSTVDLIVPSQQDAVNRAENNLQGGAVLAGFPVPYVIGPDRDQTTWTVGPSQLFVVEGEGGSAGYFPAADLRQLIEVKDTKVKDCATLTSTPLTYYNLTGVIPAEGTQQSLEMALLAKVEADQVSFGNTWEDIIKMWLKMEFVWGTALKGLISSHDEIDELDINCVWKSGKVKNEKEETDIAALHASMGVPKRFVFRKLGYTEDEIDEMMTAVETKRNVVLGQLGAKVAEMEAQQEGRSNGTEPQPNPSATE